MALRKGASRQANVPAAPPSTGTSEPKRSIKSVCSDKLSRVNGLPIAFARAVTSVVLPTPGFPSSNIGFGNWSARTTRIALDCVVGASSAKVDASDDANENFGIEKAPSWKTSSVFTMSIGP
ncbi:hypothetical protein COCC4DRAFT_61504 [Bipolaris maydis ATCC 48331]|uniref:Uncharacterized protein n=2 Tax=Cochliobolus heterostrophus TaxID=5016 RepID=M2UD98_COCH5|nr:uncharacterized protein COCC4DRAFT_61504 [Bipolaris maydis ATCC 48331]EMD85847.1 hypothetical protein COCHEDRAFT_1117649 [Bipolaris maydis C5]EMD92717.1 hypothetical protein COCHEDRAFT_1098091 [Bipolaris maydis C5]ENI04893.1 hypothetical protein COCC4DRAFT_61504 [Bipolaris maydis ATCC 48331]KAJ5056729.1 hypothetical protein J3E74DRAFT_224559 [Bipolaris maydis]